MLNFDDLTAGIGARFQQMSAGGSPFKGGNPLASTPAPFVAGALSGASPFKPGALGGGTPFQANPFGTASPFGAGPFGGGGGAFSASPFANQGNPFAAGQGWGNIPNPMNRAEMDALAGKGQFGEEGGITYGDNFVADAGSVDGYIATTKPNSPLKGMGGFISEYAAQKGVNPGLVLGIMQLESQLGADGSYLPSQNNFGGLTGTNWQGQTGNTTGMARAFATFATPQDGVRAIIDNLASPLYQGKSVQQAIGLWYLGNENASLDATDEHGNASVAQYLKTVAQAYQGIGATFDPSASIGGGMPTPGGGTARGVNQDWDSVVREYSRGGAKWTDYTNGGIRNSGNPADGFDCSSLAGYLTGMPRGLWNAQAQFDNTQRTTTPQRGDLVFFKNTNPNDASARPVSHVGIFLGNGKMLHTGTPGKGIEVVDLGSQYYKEHFHGYGRIAR